MYSRSLPEDVKIQIYRIVNLPVVLHVYETWSLSLIEGHRLRVFADKLPRRIFGHKKERT
jgi:hypothetical protein